MICTIKEHITRNQADLDLSFISSCGGKYRITVLRQCLRCEDFVSPRMPRCPCPLLTFFSFFCQAQPKIQQSWAELALILKYPGYARPPPWASTIEAS